MVRTKFKLQTKSGKARRKSQTVPNQSLSIDEIVRRFTRGLAVDVIQRPPVYSDQNDYDLEKLNRMSFADKAALAADMKSDVESVVSEAQERATQRANEKAEAAKRKTSAERSSGKGDLDNTLPDDTASENQGRK